MSDEVGDKAMAEGSDALQRLRAQAAAANINEETLLATDYLNHFNEIIMLIDMIPDMPDCIEDVEMWQPKSYPDHFRDSTFTAKDLAIEAYLHAPAEYRELFDNTVNQMNEVVLNGVKRLKELIEGGDEGALRLYAENLSRNLQRLSDVASSIIHGAKTVMDQEEIDDFLNS